MVAEQAAAGSGLDVKADTIVGTFVKQRLRASNRPVNIILSVCVCAVCVMCVRRVCAVCAVCVLCLCCVCCVCCVRAYLAFRDVMLQAHAHVL